MTLNKTIVLFSILACFTACGKKDGNDSPAGDGSPGADSAQEMRELGIPVVNPNRAKAGKAGAMNVPWLFEEGVKNKDGYFYRPFLYLTADSYSASYLCGTVIDGKRKWVKPTAISPVQWDEGSFEVLERNEDSDDIHEMSCTVRAIPNIYEYRVEDNGEKLVLTVEDEVLEFVPFRNLAQGVTNRSGETDVHTPMFKAEVSQ